MKNKKLKKIMAGVGIAGLVAGMSVNANARAGRSSCGKGSCGKGGEKKGFFQSLYDACRGYPEEEKTKTSCGKGSCGKGSKEGRSSCGKGSCGK